MNAHLSPLDTIEMAFQFLIRRGYTVTERTRYRSFGDVAVTYYSQSCSLMVATDRGEVYVFVSPASLTKPCWVDIETAVTFLLAKETGFLTVEDNNIISYAKIGDREGLAKLAEFSEGYIERVEILLGQQDGTGLCSEMQRFGLDRLERRAGLK